MAYHAKWVEQAERLVPALHRKVVFPERFVQAAADPAAFQGWRMIPEDDASVLREKVWDKGDSFTLDFGDHMVGYLAMRLRPVGSPQDAPLRLKLIFGEMPCEIGEDFDSYNGWLSRSWLQEEIVYVDVLPGEVKLPRRYCFRYLKVEVLNTSPKYKVAFDEISCTTVTSADLSQVESLPAGMAEKWVAMDHIGLKTLRDCMQTVFEDGPKRDRRLWIGDLRLQAQANYYTFKNFDLVKRCLYLFAGMPLETGHVAACLFEKPEPLADDTLLYDYALFFVSVLYDYYKASRDMETLAELWPAAMQQLSIGMERLDENGIVRDDESWYCFIDWHPELNKQAPAQAVLIYALKQGQELAQILSRTEELSRIAGWVHEATRAARLHLWDEDRGFFVSGAGRSISWASQVWMVLAGVTDEQESGLLLDRLLEKPPAVGMNTPYMYHHLVEALFQTGRREKALEILKAYWGGMMEDGADTFWETYNSSDKMSSPYGSSLINSYCHAWSCTPTYFIRKYMN